MLWLLFAIFIIAMVLSTGSYYGRRRGYYASRGLNVLLTLIWLLFLVIAFATPWYGTDDNLW